MLNAVPLCLQAGAENDNYIDEDYEEDPVLSLQDLQHARSLLFEDPSLRNVDAGAVYDKSMVGRALYDISEMSMM